MKTLTRYLAAATLLTSLGVAAVAQAQAPQAPAAPGEHRMMPGERHRMDPAAQERFRARREEHRARRLGELKQKLQIGTQQEGAWTSWTAAMRPVQGQRPNRGELRSLPTPERIDRMRALRDQRNAAMDRRMDATKAFYGALTAEQQKVFDAEGLRFARGGKRGGMGRHYRS